MWISIFLRTSLAVLVLAAIAFVAMTVGCNKTKASHPALPDVATEGSVFYVNGDPENLIKDTVLSGETIFTN